MEIQTKTKHELSKTKADLLEQYGGFGCGEVFLAARDMFSRFKTLELLGFHFTQSVNGGYMFVATPNPEEPLVSVNTDPGYKFDRRMLQRLQDRFDLTKEVVQLAREHAGLLRPLILAHEIGHILQIDPEFSSTFGTDYVAESPLPTEDYAGYVTSDPEVNADYIAQSILANTAYGEALGLPVSEYEPSQWRLWSAEHPMRETLEQFGEVNADSKQLADIQ